MKSNLEEALYLLETHNWSIIPVGKDKKPLISWKEFQNRRPTRQEIEGWFQQFPQANIAVVTGKISGIVIVDLDPRHGASDKDFNRIVTIKAKTGSGGWHYYFQYEDGIANSTGVKPGIDTRGEGGFAVLPPSIHESGNHYEWSMSPHASTPIIPLPGFVKEWITNSKPQTEGVSNWNVETLRGVEEGLRNQTAASVAGKLLLRFPKDEWESEAWQFLLAWNERNAPPLPEAELRATFESISHRELQRSESQHIYSIDKLTKTKKLEFISLGELQNSTFSENGWIVDKLIPQNGITCISGKPKIGKSLLTLYLATCIASSHKFLDHFPVEQGGVLIISKEDPERLIQKRMRYFTDEGSLPIHFSTDIDLFLDSDTYIEQLGTFIKTNSIKVIVIDSFRRIFRGEENSSMVISGVHNRFKALLKYDTTIVFIHHLSKEGVFKREVTDKLRGSSDILAMLDSLLTLERKEDDLIKVSQDVLRTDKPHESFLIRFPDFIEFNDFQFAGVVEEQKEKIDLAKQDIMELLQKGQELNQTAIIERLHAEGKIYSSTTVKNALEELVESNKVAVRPEGNKKFYSERLRN
jgi:archaellum biogenesis ATPase FlaH